SAQHFSGLLGAGSEWRHALTAAPPPDSVIVLAHWHWSLIERRRRILENWVAAGGRLVVDRTLAGDDEFVRWTGIRREQFIEDNKSVGEDDLRAQGCRTLTF